MGSEALDGFATEGPHAIGVGRLSEVLVATFGGELIEDDVKPFTISEMESRCRDSFLRCVPAGRAEERAE